MPVAAQTAEGERAVPTTQSRSTPTGQEQQSKVTTRNWEISTTDIGIDTYREDEILGITDSPR
jgi:hypothetical protein